MCPLRGRHFASSSALLELALPIHNQALAGDELTTIQLNREWRKIVASALQLYWRHGKDGLALDNEDLLDDVLEDLYTFEAVGMTAVVGSAMQYFGSTAPDGWLFCNGSAVSRATYADLFAAIGTVYGAGDGSTTFNLPDMRGRAPIGVGQGSGLTNRTLGTKLGAETHQLTVGEMPNHNHAIARSNVAGSNTDRVAAGGGSATDIGTSSIPVQNNGLNGAHNNMQPSLVCNFIIKF